MPAPAALITQCLQNDFVAPVGRYDALPNLLHIGFEEARRLMGEIPDEGPVARVMRWAQQQPDAQLKLVHIRDWHDAADAAQQQHLQQFGTHCLKDTPGARFAFAESYAPHKAATIIDSPGLNDFLGTPLGDDLAAGIAARARIGVMGVWTEAKVSSVSASSIRWAALWIFSVANSTRHRCKRRRAFSRSSNSPADLHPATSTGNSSRICFAIA